MYLDWIFQVRAIFESPTIAELAEVIELGLKSQEGSRETKRRNTKTEVFCFKTFCFPAFLPAGAALVSRPVPARQ